MKARMIRVAGLLFAGTMAFTVVYMNPDGGEETAVTGGSVRAGVSSELYADMEAYTDRMTLASGATGAVTAYLSSAGDAAVAQVEETDTVMTASAQEQTAQAQTSAYGYTNIGVASVDGNLNVRETPSTEGKLVGKMPNNAGCEILSVEGEWTKIKSGEVEGFVKSEYLLSGEAAVARAEQVKQTVATVTTTTLYVKSSRTPSVLSSPPCRWARSLRLSRHSTAG